ncbi:alginate lyase 2 [Aspergillus pseudonomiae]|uniref:Alginate lyase 2 n=1 Tax=Aspergillus pseudonomiae TaxID=1506151 RepID=A0A5N7DM33_9EURO|nr:alginate lyase 2 [Aspergillus pseudonomiae]KAB8262280.1 alginate lyase 2 [Aspergillus pseudonomiae]KAE8407109.1 alginate lyase 2 [Aspergillus pseudonomiae]
MIPKSSLIAAVLCLAIEGAVALDPKCAPGGNFDLSYWNLQLPTGQTGHPSTIVPSKLKGCDGYQESGVFYTDSKDGALVMKVPGSPSSADCVTTPNSKHCRTELRELSSDGGDKASWSPSASKNRLKATLTVPTPDDGSHGTVIGQIHIDDTISSKPVCELYYSKSGDLVMGVEKTRAGGKSIFTKVGNVPVGEKFSYEIRYESDKLSVGINREAPQTLDTYSLDSPKSYFKAGNYNQGDSASEVHFYELNVQH